MSHPQPPQRQPTPSETERYAKTLHTTALVILVACPVLIALPPRKLDFYTFGLCGATLYSANYLVKERTGRSIWQTISEGRGRDTVAVRMQSSPTGFQNAQREVQVQVPLGEIVREVKTTPSVLEEVASQRDAWKVAREREIREDVEEGKGFGDMMMEQIWEVWNWGRKREEDDDED